MIGRNSQRRSRKVSDATCFDRCMVDHICVRRWRCRTSVVLPMCVRIIGFATLRCDFWFCLRIAVGVQEAVDLSLLMLLLWYIVGRWVLFWFWCVANCITRSCLLAINSMLLWSIFEHTTLVCKSSIYLTFTHIIPLCLYQLQRSWVTPRKCGMVTKVRTLNLYHFFYCTAKFVEIFLHLMF